MMRAKWMYSAARGLAAACALAVVAAGCTDLTQCDFGLCTGAGGAGGASSSGGSMTTSSMMTSTSSVSAECDPVKLAQGASIDATCGVFVEPGKTGGDGTLTAPYGTLAEALADNPTNLPVYVCATGAALGEAATLTGTERLVGGVTCGDWKATAAKTAWTSAANAIPLTLSSTTGVLVQGFAITSASASGFDSATLQGHSSIAVLADNATATLENVDIVAGAGAAGGDAMDQSGQAPGRQSMAASFDGNVGGGCNQPGGPKKLFAMCPAGGSTEGGKGGDGDVAAGNGGGIGTPNPGLGEPNGTAGLGDDGTGGWDCAVNLGNGEFGHPGPNAVAAAAASGAGSLSQAGYVGAAGGAGPNGTIGQGGGGGGGRDLSGCSTTGPSGGSGGAGGCGGLGGGGGGAGGASIALVSINSTLTLTNVHLTAGAGGAGGAGGDGQLGGNGGNGANGGGIACKGGDGGKGGDGAGGGGGKGGPSIGLASVGPAAAPTLDDANITVAMTGAAGGAPGGGNVPGNGGDSGDVLTKASF